MFQYYQQRSILHVAFQSIYVYQLVEACDTLEDSVSCCMLEIIPLKPLLKTEQFLQGKLLSAFYSEAS